MTTNRAAWGDRSRERPVVLPAVPPAVLHATLDCELPAEVAVGGGTALFVCGWCFASEAIVESLALALGDLAPQPVAAIRMPRLDPLRALHPGLELGARDDPDSHEDPRLHAYRSGFWGLVRIPGSVVRTDAELVLSARLRGGGEARATLTTVELFDLPGRPAAGDRPPEVVIAMAAHEPPPELLRRQLDSIRAQTRTDWHCVISDDHSGPDGMRTLREAVDGDPRFTLSRGDRRLGFYGNFERALSLVPRGTRYVALADQDDIWHPDKLDTLLAAIGDAPLAFSDARVVEPAGRVVAESWWIRRALNADDPFALLVANSVTGAASLMRGELLDDALPFPPAQFAHFHDHWLGLVARALGELRYVDRPLYDYVQHAEASLGHAGANRMESLAERLRGAGELRARVALWRLHYFADVWRLRTLAAVLELRLGARMRPDARRALTRLERAERSLPALAALAVRGGRDLVRERPRTLGAEWMLAYALGWRRLLASTARERPQRRLRLDALPPTTLRAQPGTSGLHESARRVADKVAPLALSVSADAPERINLLIPTIDLAHLFAGYIGKFNLAARLAAHGARVRILTVDPVGALPPDHRRQVESYAGLSGLFDSVELAFGREAPEVQVSPNDRFVATTWWTAHIAHDAISQLGGTAGGSGGRFLYLIQEYEPFTFAMGTWAALAEQSYRLPHAALFSSELLRGYFAGRRLGVYAAGREAGDRDSRSFENAISHIAPPSVATLTRTTRRLLFYARPEDHAARNMFDLGLLALNRALERGALRGGWELSGIGTVHGARSLSLGGGARLSLRPRTDQRAYAELLRSHDVGLALMYTPHPSMVPIEMAAAGMLAVTNTFANKTAAALAEISPNLVCAEPTIDGVADGLIAAAGRIDDRRARVAGADVRWSRDWATSFPAALLDWALAVF